MDYTMAITHLTTTLSNQFAELRLDLTKGNISGEQYKMLSISAYTSALKSLDALIYDTNYKPFARKAIDELYAEQKQYLSYFQNSINREI